MLENNTENLNKSYDYIHTPTQTAKVTFFYPICCGHSYCDHNYYIERSNFDSFLILYVANGSGVVRTTTSSYNVTSGNIIILNCYEYHQYNALDTLEMYWIHFDGVLSLPYYKAILEKERQCISLKTPLFIENLFQEIFSMFNSNLQLNDALLSKHITDMLTLFFLNDFHKNTVHPDTLLKDTVSYIYNHLADELSLEILARRCSLSIFHFSRVFQKETGYTPHQFIIQSRINQAKFYLSTTNDSIKTIGLNCGFEHTSNFCKSFKKISGHTPEKYRELTLAVK